MSDAESRELLARVSRLEGVAKRWKTAGLALIAMLAMVAIMGAQDQQGTMKIIEAQRFVVKDSNGKIDAEFRLQSKEEKYCPALILYDSKKRDSYCDDYN